MAAQDRRIAVRPHLSFGRESSTSNGLGPAEIVLLTVSTKGKHYTINKESDYHEAFKTAGINSCSINRVMRITPGHLIATGEQHRLIDLENISVYPGAEAELENCFPAFNMPAKYRSLYGDEFVSSASVTGDGLLAK